MVAAFRCVLEFGDDNGSDDGEEAGDALEWEDVCDSGIQEIYFG